MIGKLHGRVDSKGEDWVIIDVGGVGYEVAVAPRTLADLPAVGEETSLAIETYVREDVIRLYGFSSSTEREWFRLLQSVQGVGAKVALAVLGVLSPGDLASAISVQDKAMVARAPGVGPKVAQRIVNELKDKVPALPPSVFAGDGIGAVAQPVQGSASADAVSALTNLGYAPAQASAAVSQALQSAGEEARAEELIRLGLKELAR